MPVAMACVGLALHGFDGCDSPGSLRAWVQVSSNPAALVYAVRKAVDGGRSGARQPPGGRRDSRVPVTGCLLAVLGDVAGVFSQPSPESVEGIVRPGQGRSGEQLTRRCFRSVRPDV